MRKLLFLFLLLLVSAAATAQTISLDQQLPLDEHVRYGTLPNGMRYYIRGNTKPEKRAELRLAVNAGSTAERDDQQGLAHFVEHMCFNGTKNFKKNELIDYLESIGTRFGAHLNAYTSFDETVYMMQIPTDADTFILKALQIFQDWAYQVSFEDSEIDKERGVVIEEWRLGLGAQDRMRKKTLPILFKDSRYAERIPIGKKEILENCSYETLRQFYSDWYRPDLMAIMAVGDFDVTLMEQRIKQLFTQVPEKKSPIPLQTWQVTGHKDFLITVAQDKEAQFPMIQLIYKQPIEKVLTVGDYRNQLARALYNGMINQRLAELQQQADPPFSFASTSYTRLVRNCNGYISTAAVQENGIARGITTLVTENERLKRFGFTDTELDRQKKEMLREMETVYNERDKTESRNFVGQYVTHFLSNLPAMSPEYKYRLYQEFLPTITLDEVNRLAKKWITEGENAVLVITAPDKESVKIPAEETIRSLIIQAQKAPLSAYVDKIIDKPLVESKPAAGKITARKTVSELNVTELTLNNGLRVFLKPTDFKNDEVLFTSWKLGGTSLSSDADYLSADYSNAIVTESGVGAFDKISLSKYLQGKMVEVGPGIVETQSSLQGHFSPQDMKTAFELMYLYLTNPRMDQTAFKSMIEQERTFLQNKSSVPTQVFFDTINTVMSSHHFRSRPMTEKMLNEINPDRAIEIYKQRFGAANGWHFTFVGNFQLAEIEPLIEEYLGSIPGGSSTESFKDVSMRSPKGTIEKTVHKGIEPKASVNLRWTSSFEYTPQNRNEVNALVKLLSIKLRENLREEQGGVYGVSVFPAMQHYPVPALQMGIGFSCSPENVTKLIDATMKEIDDVKQNGCSEKNLVKIKETFRREREVAVKENGFWLGTISNSALHGEDPRDVLTYNEWVASLQPELFKAWAIKYFDMKEMKKFVLLPEK